MFKFLNESFKAEIVNPVPISNLNISDDKKIDILINLMNSFRTNVQAWTERAYKLTIWSVGIMISSVSYCFLHSETITKKGLIFISIALFVFGLLTQLYLSAAQRAHKGNGIAISKCEAALKLCDLGSYLKNELFFGYSGKWLSSKSLRVLQIFHLAVLVISIISLIFVNPAVKFFKG